jgi:DNA polymerase III alpha subunit
MTSDTEAERVAAGLTADDIHYIRQLRDRFSIHPGDRTAADSAFLRRAEMELGILRNPSFDNYFLTDLGARVRTILKQEQKS